jgi:ABC-type multidrug transport system fused ATPase/permease subunit
VKQKFKNNFIGYFRFYYSVIGAKLFFNIGLCIMVSLMDSVGLAMFMPLLAAVGGADNAALSGDSMGNLKYVAQAFQYLGLQLNIGNILLILIVVFMIKGAFKFGQLKYQVHVRHAFMKKVRYGLVDDLQKLSYEGFLKLDAGRIQNILTREVERLFQTMNAYFNSMQVSVMLITYIVLAFVTNYQFAFFVSVGAAVSNLMYRRIYVAVKTASADVSKRGDDFNSLLIQAIHNFKYLKATGYNYSFNKRLKKVIYIQTQLMGTSLASILVSLLLFYRALGYLVSVQNQWQAFIQNVGALHSVTEFTHQMEGNAENLNGQEFTVINNNVLLQDVDFSYGDYPVLKRINIDIRKNQTIAFIGESGSGKTTLANMISALIQPKQGKFLIDGRSIADFDLTSYRNKIGYISQEPVIFNDDIFNNVTFWAEPNEQNIHRFWNAIEMAALSGFIAELPEKEKTKLGDNGILISGGQKQRISIARELYKDAQILILDEATSALDSETEKMIKENIDHLHGKYTIVVIAHRLSTIKNVDTIYLLEKGTVTASGSFDAMIEQSSRFKRMVELQEM